jgi:acetylornithine deacetylase/succinyl-diaminopimelate desuccinylase-like protein
MPPRRRGSWRVSASRSKCIQLPKEAVTATGMVSATNLVVRHRFGDGPVIALNAPRRCGPPGLGWRHDPYGAAVEDGPHGPTMFGRGVAVSKSDFATYAFALLALKALAEQGQAMRGTVELHLTYDEETVATSARVGCWSRASRGRTLRLRRASPMRS